MTIISHKTFLIAPILCAAIPLLWFPFAEYAAVSSWGNGGLLWAGMFFALPLLAAFCIFIAAPIALFFRRVRRIALVSLLCAVAYFAAFIIAVRIGERVRMQGFDRLAERSAPLVQAIRAYEQKKGRPPDALQLLVPEFIPSVPSTGMGAYPEYRYVTGYPTNYDGNPWVLYVFTPAGGINFDQFMYFPRQNYPTQGYGGALERVRDWAYVHE
jgi:hypothetical protein